MADGKRSVRLTKGNCALVCLEDFQFIACRRWSSLKGRNTWYAVSNDGIENFLMHRVIAGTGPTEETDHWDGDGLNNRES